MSFTRQGILVLILGIATVPLIDSVVEQLSSSYPLLQVFALVSLFALPFNLAIVRWFDGRLSTIATPGWWKMVARGLLIFAAFLALAQSFYIMPAADVVMHYFTYPLLILAIAALFLGEKPSRSTIIALTTAFVGLSLFVGPASTLFDFMSFRPILAAICLALSMVIARPLGRTETAASMAFWGSFGILLGSLVLMSGYTALVETGFFLFGFEGGDWVMPNAPDMAIFAICGGITAAGLMLLTQAYRLAPPSTLAPLEYCQVIWLALFAAVISGNIPNTLGAWVGIAAIIVAGMIVIRGQSQKEKAAPEGAAQSAE